MPIITVDEWRDIEEILHEIEERIKGLENIFYEHWGPKGFRNFYVALELMDRCFETDWKKILNESDNNFVRDITDITKSAFDNLLGLEISNAIDLLGYWWRCEYANWPKYRFERTGFGYLELHTDDKNIVVKVII